jgi:tetratricopeptide (TPR) repeat protein
LHISHLYQRLGQLNKAEQFVTSAVNLFKLLQKPSSHGAALNRLAEIVRQERGYAKAECFTDIALASLADDDLEYGHTYLIKGRIAFDQRQWDIAQQHFETARYLSKISNVKRREAVCIQNLGRVSQIKNNYKQAIDYYEDSINILKDINDSFNLAAVQMNLGVVYSLTNQPQKALQQYSFAEPIFAQMQDLRYLAKLYTNQGIEWYNSQRWQLSSQAFQNSADIWKQIGDHVEYANAIDGLGMVFAAQCDFEKAIQLFNHALTTLHGLDYQDTLQNLVTDIQQHLHDAKLEDLHSKTL